MAHEERVLVTVTGKDRPGITAALTAVLAETGARLLDLEQVAVQGRVTLCLDVGLPERRGVLKELLFTAKELGVDLDFEVLEPGSTHAARGPSYVATIIGRSLGVVELQRVAAALAEERANIERISRLSEGSLASVEVRLTLAPGRGPEPLKRALLQVAAAHGIDVALQPESLYRRSKRLVVMDMDSTLIRIEVIDELARAAGVFDAVSRITERAMAGEMDYDESLRQRVALLRGLPVTVLETIAAELPLTEGAETLVRALRRLGFRTAVISGGFSVAAEALQRRLGIDYAHSNVLEIEDGRLTGRVRGAIVNGARKAVLLEEIAAREGVLLDQVIAVGDGANDLLMLEKAGLGIAFRAKPKLREAADSSISAAGLDAILYLLGISGRELAEIV